MELAGRRLNRRTALVLAIAVAASTALLVAALSVHQGGQSSIVVSTSHGSYTVAQPQTTFVQQNGDRSLFLVAFPLFAALVATAALWFRSPAKSGPGPYAVTAGVLLVVEALVGILTIGIFVLPIAALVLFGCATFSEYRMLQSKAKPRVGSPVTPRRDPN
jgi:hypothetical protein